jgi:hypothetical protein
LEKATLVAGKRTTEEREGQHEHIMLAAIHFETHSSSHTIAWPAANFGGEGKVLKRKKTRQT